MDIELLMALWLLWGNILLALLICGTMWIYKRGEAFHPHLTDLEQRHGMYQVVKDGSKCMKDFAVKSISAYIAPRGSSSDKYFTVIITICSVAGCFGAYRWYVVEDATANQAILCAVGFFALLLIPMFEFDVSTNSFLEEKLSVTNSFIRMLGADKMLNEKWNQYSPELLDLVTSSKDLALLYDEAKGVTKVTPTMLTAKFLLHMTGAYLFYKQDRQAIRILYFLLTIQFLLYVTGAGIYVGCVTAAIVSNDYSEKGIAVASGLFMNIFAITTYLCGSYIPIGSIHPATVILDGWVFPWNPFLYEKNFLIKLQKAINSYHAKKNKLEDPHHPEINSPAKRSRGSGDASASPLRKRSSNTGNENSTGDKAAISNILIPESKMESNADRIIKSRRAVAFAKNRPKLYIRLLSYLMVLSELASLITPVVGIGFQWITALCRDQSNFGALLSISYITLQCIITGDYDVCNAMKENCVYADYKRV